MTIAESLLRTINRRAAGTDPSASLDRVKPAGACQEARVSHRQIPGSRASPLAGRDLLAEMLGPGGSPR